MIISPEVETCVVFIACRQGGEYVLKGIGCVVSVDIDGPEKAIFVVTARHVVEALHDKAQDGHGYLRVNVDGKAEWVKHPLNHWRYAEDDRVDVAFLNMALSTAWDHKAISLDIFATAEVIKRQEITIGNELFFPGLFVGHSGESRNVPIVRRGNLAAMPHERVKTRRGPMELYLVEARSIGGLSGSPVFVIPGPFAPSFYFLGLIHGHFGVRDIPDVSQMDALPLNEDLRSVNMGIGMVIPATDVKAAILQSDVVEQIDALKQAAQLRKGTGVTLVAPPQSSIEL